MARLGLFPYGNPLSESKESKIVRTGRHKPTIFDSVSNSVLPSANIDQQAIFRFHAHFRLDLEKKAGGMYGL
jgi:hypothetical protein